MPTDEISAAAAGTWTLGDLIVNRMGFGSMRITANPDRELAVRVLRRAVELGVNHIDTAAFYFSPGGILNVGTGPIRYATELIREALAPYPEDLVIATKIGPGVDPSTGFYEASTPAQLRSQVEENLRRLGRDHLDVVNLRIVKRPGRDSVAERFGALAELRDAGLIRHLGLSNIRVDHLDEAQAIAPVVGVQNAYAIDAHRTNDEFVEVCGAVSAFPSPPRHAASTSPAKSRCSSSIGPSMEPVGRATRSTFAVPPPTSPAEGPMAVGATSSTIPSGSADLCRGRGGPDSTAACPSRPVDGSWPRPRTSRRTITTRWRRLAQYVTKRNVTDRNSCAGLVAVGRQEASLRRSSVHDQLDG